MPDHQHLYRPGHAASGRHALERGWPSQYLAACVLCGVAVDLVAVLRTEQRPPPHAMDGGAVMRSGGSALGSAARR